MIGVDTNLLVYAHRAGCPQHARARAAIERAAADPRGWGIALPSVAEFWAVVTHPAAEGGPSSGNQARSFLAALRETATMHVWVPFESLAQELTAMAASQRIAGARVFDLQIALIAKHAGAEEIWTHDARFFRLGGLRVVDPMRDGRP